MKRTYSLIAMHASFFASGFTMVEAVEPHNWGWMAIGFAVSALVTLILGVTQLVRTIE
jgi:hypothetical protein